MKSLFPVSCFRHPSRARRKGSVLTVVSFSMVALIGFTALVVDYGFLTMDANRLQRACDAAALAGISELHKTNKSISNYLELDAYNARKMAYDVAQHNGVTIPWNNIVVADNNSTIKVTASEQRSFLFAPILGIKKGLVKRSAKAGVFPVTQMSTSGPVRVAPMGITWETYNAYHQDRSNSHALELIRQNKQTFGLDDIVLFDLRDQPSKSPAHMQRQLTGENVEYVNMGDWETTLNAAHASQDGKFSDGLDTLFAQSAGAPWYDAGAEQDGVRYSEILSGASPRDNPRIVYIIVTPSTSNPNNGTFNTQVQGLVPVYLEGYEYEEVTTTTGKGKGKKASTTTEQVLKVNMRFLSPGEISGASGVESGGSTNTPISGARVFRLLE